MGNWYRQQSFDGRPMDYCPSLCTVSMHLITMHLQRFHGERVVAKARGGRTQRVIVYFCQSAARGQIGKGGGGGVQALLGPEGLLGFSYPLKVYLSRGSPAGSLTLADGVNVLTLLTNPRAT